MPSDISKTELIDILVLEYNFNRLLLEKLSFVSLKQQCLDLEVF